MHIYRHQAGEEFPKKYWGRPAKVVRALYGLPIAGNNFRLHLNNCLKEFGYTPCKADPDVYFRVTVKSTGERYYGYLIAYVDNIICSREKPDTQMKAILR